MEKVKYISINETELKKYTPIQAAFLMIRCGDSYLLKRDCEGGHWELPATGISANETPRECMMRNYSDKYDLNESDIRLIGVSKVVFEKTESRPEPKPEFLALFEAVVDNKDDIFDKVDKKLHRWYVLGDDVNPYCSLCRGLIEYHNSQIH